jgi:outer membrane receptor protein involved in Fe transport
MTRPHHGPVLSRASVRLLAVALSLLACGGVLVADRHAELAFEGMSLVEALELLRDGGLRIVYSSELVHGNMVVAEEPRSTRPREILDELLAPHGLGSETGPGGVLLVVKASARGGVTGLVRSARDAHPLSGARVKIAHADSVARTGADGTFHVSALPAGRHDLNVTAPGYFPARIEKVLVRANRVTELRIQLEPLVALNEEVVVHAADAARSEPERRDRLDHEEIGASSGSAHDALRAIGRIPGVAGSDESARFHVRGGDDDELLILLDGLELYEAYHLQDHRGLLSIIDSRTVATVDFLGGAFPAEYGDRMSGVVDVRSFTPTGASNAGFGLSTDDAHLSTRAAFAGGRGHWLGTARRGYPDGELDALGAEETYDPRYYDAFGKIVYETDERSTVSLNLLTAHDDLEGHANAALGARQLPGEFVSNYRSNYAWLTLSRLWRPDLHSTTILSFGDLYHEREGASPPGGITDQRTTGILGLKQNWTFAAGRQLLKWGLDFKLLRADYRYVSTAGEQPSDNDPPPLPETDLDTRIRGNDLGVYVSDRIRLAPRLSVALGVRWDEESYTGSQSGELSPRVNLLHRIGRSSALRAGWGYHYQPQRINELPVEDGVAEFFPVQRAEHRLVGFEHTFRNGPNLRLTAFQKEISDPRPRFENLFDPLALFPEASADRVRIDASRARAHGFEIALRGPTDRRVFWSTGYTLAYAEDLIDGAWVPRSWDQRHTIVWGLACRPSRNWLLAVLGTHHTGRPTTPVTVESTGQPDGPLQATPLLDRRNGDRLPSYHRLDLRTSRSLFVGDGELRFYVDVANVLDSENACCVETIDLVHRADGSVGADPVLRSGLGRWLSAGFVWRF